jgi:hypothetical protein
MGRGDIFMGVTVPAPGSIVPLVNGIPQSGTFVGSTMGDAVWSFKPKHYTIKTQQATGPVGYVITDDEATLDFTFGEFTYRNLLNLMAPALDQITYVSVGGLIFPNIPSCLIVAPRRAGGYIQAMIYAAYFGGDRVLTFAREKDSPIKVTAMAQAVTTRPLGDQLGYVHPGP